MATGKSLEFTLSGKKKSAYFIKLAGSELTRILECLRPERCAPGRSKYPFIRDLIELRIGDVDGYVGRLTETGGTIWFEGEPYRRIVCSAGHARGKKVFFLHTAVWDQVMDILACGMDLTQEFSPTKVNAYFGLAASNSVPVAELPRMVVVDDCHRAIEDIFDVVRADVAGGVYEVAQDERASYDANLFDGGGLVTVEQAERWAKELKLGYTPGAFQIRALPGLKGCLFAFDVKGFAEAHGCGTITDIWGKVHDSKDVDVILTRSQFKFHSQYESYEQWETAFKTPVHDYRRTFNIAAVSEKKPKGDVYSAYQMLQTVDLSKKQITTLARASVEEIKKMHTDPRALLKYLGVDNYDEDSEEESWYQIPPYFQALNHDEELLNDNFVFGKVKEAIGYAEHRTYAGKLKIKGNYQILAPDIYALAQHAFGLEVTGIVGAWEVYSHYWNEKSAESITEVDMLRNPHVGCEHCVMKLHSSPEATKWFQYQPATVVTSIHDTAVLRCGGADFDGDKVLTTKNRVLLDAAKASKPNTILPIIDNSAKAITCAMNDLVGLLRADQAGFKCDIGVVVNPVTKLWSLPRTPERDRAISVMSVIAGVTIDAAKTGQKAKIPEDIKELYSQVKKPMFMRYRKDAEKGKAWGEQDCTMNRVCRHLQEEFRPYHVEYPAGEFSPTWLIRRPRPFDCRGVMYKKLRTLLRGLQDEYNGLCQDRSSANGKRKADYDASIAHHFAACRKKLLDAFYEDRQSADPRELLDCLIQLFYYDDVFAGVHDRSILWHAFEPEMIERVKAMRANKSAEREAEFEKVARRRGRTERNNAKKRQEEKFGLTFPIPVFADSVAEIQNAGINSAAQRLAAAIYLMHQGGELRVEPGSRDGISPAVLCGIAGTHRRDYDKHLNSLENNGVIDVKKDWDGAHTIMLRIPLGTGEQFGQVKSCDGLKRMMGKIFPKKKLKRTIA